MINKNGVFINAHKQIKGQRVSDTDQPKIPLERKRKCHAFLGLHCSKSQLRHLDWWRWWKLYLKRSTFELGILVRGFQFCDALKWRSALGVVPAYCGCWCCTFGQAAIAHAAMTSAYVAAHAAVASMDITHTAMTL